MNTRLDLPLANSNLKDTLLCIQDLVKTAGGRVLVVGGGIRDALLGFPSKDLDLEVYGIPPTMLIQILSSHFPLNLVGEAFGVIKLKSLPIEISLPRRESKRGLGHKGFDIYSDPSMTIEDAASRRDFTINAMAWDPETHEILDPYNGLRDLGNRILRHTTMKFQDDPLRILRGLQFSGRFSMAGARETLELCQKLLHEYSTLPIERIWGEWHKWAAQSVLPAKGLQFLRESGWIQVYPELQALLGCPQDPEYHPEGDVWAHTLLVTNEAARIAERDGLETDDRITLALAALCHDLGKPQTTRTMDTRVRSPGHCETIEVFQAFLDSIGTPPRIRDRVVVLCRYHLTHIDFRDSARHVRRVAVALASAGETIDMLSRLVEADHSSRPPLAKELPSNMQCMLEVASQLNLQRSAPDPLLLGRHLLEMGFSPSPTMGIILKEAFEAQLDGEIHTLEDAKAWVRKKPR